MSARTSKGEYWVKQKLLTLLLGTSLVLAACGGEEESKETNSGSNSEDTTASANVGEDLYQKSCVGCHGGNLEGTVGPALDKVGNSLSKEEIETIILEGAGGMPGGLVTGDDASQLAEWLSTKK